MSRVDADLVTAVVALADDLDAAGCPYDQARARLAPLRTSYPTHHFDLVARSESFDGRMTYDLVVRQGNGVSFSVAVTSGAGLPWPLRSVTRASEQDFLRVDATRVSVGEALATLDFIWDDRPLLLQLVNACIARQAVDESPVELTPAELQEAADAFRRAKGLLRAEDTLRWLEERSLSMRNFADLVARSAAAAALRKRTVADRVDAWFATHSSQLRRLVVAWAGLPPGSDEPRLDGDPFGAVIAAYKAGRPAGVAEWSAIGLPPHFAVLADAEPGQVVTIEIDACRVEAIVVQVVPPTLDAATRADIERRLFDEWLAGRRRDADIEWFWGNSARTSQVA